MPSLTTYWIIVIALAAAALGLWLLLRKTPARPVRPVPRPGEPLPAAEVKPDAEPAAEPIAREPAEPAEPVAVPARRGRPPKARPSDALTTLKGLGPKAAARLNALGVTRFEQVAGWTDEEAARIDAEMGPFRGRIVRDKWIEQAQHLAQGDRAGFEAKFGKLGEA